MPQIKYRGGMYSNTTGNTANKNRLTAATVRRLGAHTGTHKSTDLSITSGRKKSNENFDRSLCEHHQNLNQHRRNKLFEEHGLHKLR